MRLAPIGGMIRDLHGGFDEGEDVMAVARILLWEGSEEQLDWWAKMQQEKTKEAVAHRDGRGLWLVNREKGEAVTLTIYESAEQAARANLEEALGSRRQIAQTTGCRVTYEAAYEVITEV